MSLYKQLWLAVIFLLTLVFGGSFIVSSLSARNYLEQQLGMKNADNATALALSLSQQGADEVMLELTLAAQFDTGFYEMIQLTDPNGKIITLREDRQTVGGAPDWFTKLFPMRVKPGVAAVQKGWQQLGTLTLRSHSRFAYRELWQGTQKMAAIFLLAMILAGSLGSYILRRILRPLEDVVEQAKAIGERRFITIPEPATQEFRNVARSMNNLSQRIQGVLQQEAGRLEKWRQESHLDKVSGLLNRQQFMKVLGATLESDDANSSGVISMVRIHDLGQMNQVYGHKTVDGFLKEIGKGLSRIAMGNTAWVTARLNGSDFVILAPRADDPVAVARQAQQAVREVRDNHSIGSTAQLPAAACMFQHGDAISEIMTGLDASLLASDEEGESAVSISGRADIQVMPVREQLARWRKVFAEAFTSRRFSLAEYPVEGLDGELLHLESPARLALDGELLSAGQFLPWINRLDLADEFDKHVVDLAIRKIEEQGKPLGINLSVACVTDSGFLLWLTEKLSSHPEAAAKLWVELQEGMAYRHLENFRKLCTRAKAYGTRVGIEHMGHQLADIGKLGDVGLDYLKVDSAFVRDIDQNVANQTLLRTLCTVGHSIGLTVIAEGVSSDTEWQTVRELGMDGVTGPAVKYGS